MKNKKIFIIVIFVILIIAIVLGICILKPFEKKENKNEVKNELLHIENDVTNDTNIVVENKENVIDENVNVIEDVDNGIETSEEDNKDNVYVPANVGIEDSISIILSSLRMEYAASGAEKMSDMLNADNMDADLKSVLGSEYSGVSIMTSDAETGIIATIVIYYGEDVYEIKVTDQLEIKSFEKVER